MLDAFFGALKPKKSLIFAYAKRTPLIDDEKWVLIGVGRITSVGELQEWDYNPPNHDGLRSYLWERSVSHTIRPDGKDGILLPYHDLLERCDNDPALDPSPYMAFIPDAYREEFLFASEHVSPGTAIAALLSIKTALENYEEQFAGDWSQQKKWIDQQLGELWTMRGPYPGLGSVFCAMGVEHGFQLAYHCWEIAGENGDPWPVLAALVKDPTGLADDLKDQVEGFADTWAYLAGKRGADRLAFGKLLARFDISLPQAMRWWDESSRSNASITLAGEELSDAAIMANPYLLYECDRDQPESIAFETIDQGAFPEKAIASKHPLDAPSKLSGPVDGRRLRAATTAVLEEAAINGNSLMSRAEIIAKLHDKPLSPPLPASDDQYEIHADKLSPTICDCQLENRKPAYQLDRLVVCRELIASTVKKRVNQGKRHSVEINWLDKLDATFPDDKKATKGSSAYLRRQEQAAALEELAASRFSVLIGPAGTGKTTLLKFLCEAEPIANRGILLLAPTGKARVRLQLSTGLEAKTLAQFLRPQRYHEATQSYHVIGDTERYAACKTVIVDEASMLTEEQLAALLDGLSGVERIILVGDPSQLPPIGAGRPFVDIVKLLRPESFLTNKPRVGKGYAELTIGSRQKGKERRDLEFAELFSGRSAGPAHDEIIAGISDGEIGPHLRICSWSSPAALATMLPHCDRRGTRYRSRKSGAVIRCAGARRQFERVICLLQFLELGTSSGPLANPLTCQGRSSGYHHAQSSDPARLSRRDKTQSGTFRSPVCQGANADGWRRNHLWRQSHQSWQPSQAMGLPGRTPRRHGTVAIYCQWRNRHRDRSLQEERQEYEAQQSGSRSRPSQVMVHLLAKRSRRRQEPAGTRLCPDGA